MVKKLTFIELNEFNLDLIIKYAKKYNLKNLKRILKSNHTRTNAFDQKEHFGLDPWVQWVSIHTGKPSNIHQIRGIGESFNLKHLQIWDYLGKNKISSGVWGVMNGINKGDKKCKFFVPDPWSYSQDCFPNELSKFIALPKFYAKNYIEPNKLLFLKSILKTTLFFMSIKNILIIYEDILFILNLLIRNGINNGVMFSIFDLCSTTFFLDYRRNMNPDFTILFLNSLAHNQHHNWNESDKKLLACFKVLDRIFYKLTKAGIFEKPFIIANGLSQVKINKDYFIYRQKDPENFLYKLQIPFIKIEQSMTNDGQIFFKDKISLINGFNILKKIKIKNQNLFFLSTKLIENKKIFILFYQLDFYEDTNQKTFFYLEKKAFSFNEYFVKVANRTGRHVPTGDILHNKIFFDKEILNHNIYEYIVKFFKY